MSVGKPKNLLRSTLNVVGVLLYRLGLANTIIGLSKNRVRALLYHAVEDDNNPFTQGLNVGVSPATFSANLDYYKKHYNVVPVSALTNDDLPLKPLVITFDDGYHSVYENAVPALCERQMSACTYLISRAVRGDLVWVNLLNYVLAQHPDRSRSVLNQFSEFSDVDFDDVIPYLQNTASPTLITRVYEALSEEFTEVNAEGLYSTADEINEMRELGMEFGFHTADHFNLRNCSSDELDTQLDASKISALTNTKTFAYPFGYYNNNAIDQLSQKNYEVVMTVGNNNQQSYSKHLDRSEVFSADPAVVFAQLEVVEPLISWLRKIVLKSKALG